MFNILYIYFNGIVSIMGSHGTKTALILP